MIRRDPRAMLFSVLLHLALVLLIVLVAREKIVSYMDSAAPIESPQPEESVPVVVEESDIAKRLEAAKARKAQQQQQILGLKRRESEDLQALRKQAEEERLRIEKLKQQQLEEEKQLAAEREKRLAEEQKAAEEQKRREEAEKQRAAEEKRLAEEKRKREEAEKQRLAEEKKRKEEAEKKRLAEEKRKKEEAEKQRLAAEQKKREEAARKKREFEEALAARDKKVQTAARKQGQSTSKNQKRDGTGSGGKSRKSAGAGGKEYNKFIALIRSKVKRNWRRPPGTPSSSLVKLKVKLFPGGGVADVSIARTSGDTAYDKSARDAVFAADPLPVPSGKAFDKFRTLNLEFTPTGIR